MNDQLTVANEQPTLDSREVAVMVRKGHKDLLRDIRTYITYLMSSVEVGERKIAPSDFFVESTYINEQNKRQPCYRITKKGCELIAHKMTGKKGILFSASYIERFHEMEEQLSNTRFKLPTTYKEALLQLVEKEEQNEQLTLENAQKEQIIHELKPRADYTDRILKNNGLVTITQIAKDYGMSGKEMNELLHELGIQYKQSKQWLLYKKYHGKGYTHSQTIDIVRSDGRPDVQMNTKWTQKGRLFIYETLKQHDVLPTIEKQNQTA